MKRCLRKCFLPCKRKAPARVNMSSPMRPARRRSQALDEGGQSANRDKFHDAQLSTIGSSRVGDENFMLCASQHHR